MEKKDSEGGGARVRRLSRGLPRDIKRKGKNEYYLEIVEKEENVTRFIIQSVLDPGYETWIVEFG